MEDFLTSKSDMLKDYYSLEISEVSAWVIIICDGIEKSQIPWTIIIIRSIILNYLKYCILGRKTYGCMKYVRCSFS